jgi:hypothetical protein
MTKTPPIRFVVIGLICLPVYLLLGCLTTGVVHTGPHDWFMLPGITIEHYYGHGLRVEDVRPHVLLLALAVCYAITWYLFRWASQYGKKRTP